MQNKELIDIIKKSHQSAGKDKESYRYQFMQHLLNGLTQDLAIKMSQSEMDRFEKGLWFTAELWQRSQGLNTTSEFLKLVLRYTAKYINDKQQPFKPI